MQSMIQHLQGLVVLMLQPQLQTQLQPVHSQLHSKQQPAAFTFGGYSRVMPEPFFVNDASKPQEHNPLPVTQSRAVAASREIFAAKGCSATVVNDAGQVIGSESFTKRSSKNRAGMT